MKYNVLIQGILGTVGENLRKTVKRLANKLKGKVNDYNVCGTHRVPSQKKVRTICGTFQQCGC